MGKMSRNKGKRGEREFAEKSDGIRTWWTAEENHPDAGHDVFAHDRPWEVKFLKTGFTQAYNALEEFEEHEAEVLGEAEYAALRATGQSRRPIVAARMNGKPWLVIMYYDDWKEENALQE